MSEVIRAFVAIELPEPVKAHLVELMSRLRWQGLSGVRWVRPEGIHLTLKFLGNVEVTMLDAIHKALERAAGGQEPFALHLEGTGAFPRPANPRVLWVGLAGDLEALGRIQRRVEEGLVALGLPPEERPFSPHLTLGRVQAPLPPAQRQRLAVTLEGLTPEVSLAIPARAVSLMRSTLLPSGAVYDQLRQVTLSSARSGPP
ncbi:MAG: RNA 2',3'-cyclic phosphodiesterase [Chloroflexi bacterium]|nr:RNA 2',3'-cyclic phosphodiesterase [Chloroflexota bacterium]